MSSPHQEQRASSLADDVMGSSNNVSASTSSVSMHVDPTVHEPRAISAPSTQKIAKTSVKSKSLTATASKVSKKEITDNVKDDNGKKLQEPDDPELIITRGLKEILAKDRAMRKNNELSVSKKCKTSGSDSSKGKGPNFVICYLCGRQFGSSSISIHRPQCYLKMLIAWERGDPATRGPRPLDPESYEANVKAKMAANQSSQAGRKIQLQQQEQQSKPITLSKQSDANSVTSVVENTDNKENLTETITSESNEKMLDNNSAKEEGNEYDATELYNELALEAFKKQLAPCPHCHRTFLPDRLVVHLRGCKPKSSESNEDDHHDVKSKKKQINTSLNEVHTSTDDSKKNKKNNNSKHQTALTQSDANKSNQKSKNKTSLQEMIKLKRKELKQKVSDDTTREQMEKVESNEENKEDGASDINKSEKKCEKIQSSEVHEIQHYEEEEEETKHEHAELHDMEKEDAALNENDNTMMNRTSQVIEPEARTESPRPHPPTEENVSNSILPCTTTTTTITNKELQEENVDNKQLHVKESSKTRNLLEKEEEEHKEKCKEMFTSVENDNTSKACSASRENSLLLETLPYTSATDDAALPTTMEAEARKEGKEAKETSHESEAKETSVKNETNKCTNDDDHNDNDDENYDMNHNDDNGDEIDDDDEIDENYDYQVKKIKLNNVSHFKNVPSRLKAELEAHRIRFSEPVICTYCHKKFHTQRIKQHEELCALRNSPQLHAEVKRAKSNRSMSGGNSNQSRQLFATTNTNNSSSVNTNSSFDSNTNQSKSLSNSPMSSFTKRTSQSVGAMPLVMTGPTIKFTELEQNDHVIRRALSVNDDRLSIPPNDHDNKGCNNKKARINKKLETKSKNSRGNTKNKTASSSSLPSHTTDSETISGEAAINAKLKTHEMVSQNKNSEKMSAPVAIKYCPECGVKVQHDKQKFCMSCGTKICV